MSYLQPDAKLIVILRNPATATYSSYKFFSNPEEISVENFDRCVRESIELYRECLLRFDEKECVFHMPIAIKKQSSRNCMFVLRALALGQYAQFISEWMRNFPKKNFHIVKLERYSSGKTVAISKAWEFLGLREPSRTALKQLQYVPDYNSAKIHTLEMSSNAKNMLMEFFRRPNLRLAELLEDRDFLWLS